MRPDAQVRLGAGALVGNNVYNTTGAGQTRSAAVGNLGTATFRVRTQNDGNTTQTFTVKGLGGTNRYKVTYKDGATNVTTQVLASTFTTLNSDRPRRLPGPQAGHQGQARNARRHEPQPRRHHHQHGERQQERTRSTPPSAVAERTPEHVG